MNLLIVSGIFPPDIGGPATFSHSLATLLKTNGHSVKVVTLGDSTISKIDSEEYEVIRIYRHMPRAIRFLIVSLKIRQHSKNSNLVICTGMHEETAVALFGRKISKIAKVVGDPVWERAVNLNKTQLSLDDFNLNFYKVNTPMKLHRYLLRKALNSFDLVFTPGENLMILLQKWKVKTKLIFLPNAVILDTKQIVRNLDKGKKLVVVSRLVKWKRIDLVLKVASSLNFDLTIIGDGPERVNLEKMANFTNKPATFLGSLKPEQVTEQLRKNHIFVLLSEYEGMSYSILEAMSLGMLVVVSNIKSNSDLVEHLKTGFVFDTDNFDRSIDELKVLIEDKTQIEQICLNAREYVRENHSLQKQADLLLKLAS